MSINYVNLDHSDNYKKLETAPVCSIKEELSTDRIKKYSASAGAGLVYNFAGKS